MLTIDAAMKKLEADSDTWTCIDPRLLHEPSKPQRGKNQKNSRSLPRKNTKGSKLSSQAEVKKTNGHLQVPGPSEATGSQLKEDKGIGKMGGGGHSPKQPFNDEPAIVDTHSNALVYLGGPQWFEDRAMEMLSKSPFEDDVGLEFASTYAEGQRLSEDATAEFRTIPTLEELDHEFQMRAGIDIGSEEGLFDTYLDIAEQSLALEESSVGSSSSAESIQGDTPGGYNVNGASAGGGSSLQMNEATVRDTVAATLTDVGQAGGSKGKKAKKLVPTRAIEDLDKPTSNPGKAHKKQSRDDGAGDDTQALQPVPNHAGTGAAPEANSRKKQKVDAADEPKDFTPIIPKARVTTCVIIGCPEPDDLCATKRMMLIHLRDYHMDTHSDIAKAAHKLLQAEQDAKNGNGTTGTNHTTSAKIKIGAEDKVYCPFRPVEGHNAEEAGSQKRKDVEKMSDKERKADKRREAVKKCSDPMRADSLARHLVEYHDTVAEHTCDFCHTGVANRGKGLESRKAHRARCHKRKDVEEETEEDNE